MIKIDIRQINSFIVAMMLLYNSLTVVFGPINKLVVYAILFLFLILLVFNIRTYNYIKHIYSFVLIIITVFVFLFNIVLYSKPIIDEYFLYFLCFGVPFLLLPIDKINFEWVIKYMFILSIIYLPFYLKYNYGYNVVVGEVESDSGGTLMTMSYRMLPLIFVGFYELVGRNKNIIIKIIALIVTILYTGLFFIIASRGALVALILFITFYYINSAKSKKTRYARMVILFSLLIIISLSFGLIIEYVHHYLDRQGINVLAINRIIYALEIDAPIDSGRFDLYKQAIEQFKNSPLWGNGIGSFNNYSEYPHNLFLQIMVEGGLFAIIPFMLIFFIGFFYLLSSDYNSSYFKILLLAFCAGIVQLFFSFYYWGSHYFWMFIFLVMYKTWNNVIMRIKG